jgi:hypothetical protein
MINDFNNISNKGNYIITKNTITNINYDNNILDKISAGEIAYFNLQFFRQFSDFEFHIIKDLEYNHFIHDDSEYLKTNKNCNSYLSKYVFPEFLKLENYVIFKKTDKLEDSLIRYFSCVLFAIKYNLNYTLEDEIDKFIFYKGIDQYGNDIAKINSSIEDMKNEVYNNNDSIAFNTLGFIKSKISISELESNNYINHENGHGLYVKNYININHNEFLDYFENKNKNEIKNKNLLINGYFQIDDIYLLYKNEILDYINKNKDSHYIKTYDEVKFLMKDLIDDIELEKSKKYNIVIHIQLGNFNENSYFIEYQYYEKLFNKINFNNKKNAIVVETPNTREDKLFLEKCIMWFKNKNLDINVESNDILINFNIMKQCDILICSMSKLSWNAAYLSQSIKLCYMPNNNLYNEERNENFKKPIENTILYDTKNTILDDTENTIFGKLKVFIITLKNCQERLENIETLKINLLKIGLDVDIYNEIDENNIKIINIENNSENNSENISENISDNNNIKIINYNSEIYFYNKKIDNKNIKNNELCFELSHLNIYKKLLIDDLYDKYLILEDNTELEDNLDILYEKLKKIPEKFDVLHIAKNNLYKFELKEQINEYFYNIKNYYFNKKNGYIVSKEGAIKLLLSSNNKNNNLSSNDVICHRFSTGDDFNLYVLKNYLFNIPENKPFALNINNYILEEYRKS